jgi:hypothetical protein
MYGQGNEEYRITPFIYSSQDESTLFFWRSMYGVNKRREHTAAMLMILVAVLVYNTIIPSPTTEDTICF